MKVKQGAGAVKQGTVLCSISNEIEQRTVPCFTVKRKN
ncbi:hypothetical protein SYNTR_1865 [Candidatus Syntrophocurvum alkaliphilum]|uniref:Uncharacterized protein n=1 Tax=Candidatus Syntrophocurvum alkaliphilum TaxID=2293317 RepID=A0A6I6DI91_9FIRM|nr:hypothetical protein SYNTR_1865 [Candidatus Syntrophocurvum alkaliphilum]